MQAHVYDWLNLLLRWAHIVAAVAWIGSSFFFMWLDANLTPTGRERSKGELWMVHSGGFFHVEKHLLGPGQMPKVLHWFKWEAAITWLTGMALLVVVYYLGHAMVDSSVNRIGERWAMAIGLGSPVVAWAVYDGIWSSPLRKSEAAASLLSLALIAGATVGLTRTLGPRAAYIHVAVILGTIMVANVWMRIIPAQRRMVEATMAGREPDHSQGERAKQRSVHNNYVTFPVIFIMISNHFPGTYGYEHRWLILLALAFASGGVRHVMNKGRRVAWLLVPSLALLVAMFLLTAPASKKKPRPPADPAIAAAKDIDPATTGRVHGVVRLDGAPPAPESLTLAPGCVQDADPPRAVMVKDGLLQNVVVSIIAGADAWKPPPAPTAEVVIDQRGCMYAPRVVAVRAGQPVVFANSDPLMHNIHAVTEHNDEFNMGMEPSAPRIMRAFSEPEVVRMKCDVHPWMAAWIAVVPHPWFAVTGADGAFELAGVPPGAYTVRAWHEHYAPVEHEVTVLPGGAATLDFTLR